jgi:hypothetical protein
MPTDEESAGAPIEHGALNHGRTVDHLSSTQAKTIEPKAERPRGYVRETLRWFKTAGHAASSRLRHDAVLWTALATLLMAFTTLVYTYYARKQWQEMSTSSVQTDQQIQLYREQVNLYSKQLKQLEEQVKETRNLAMTAKDSLVSVQRAFVNFDPTPSITRQLGPIPDADAYGETFSVRMTNIGNTPTRDMFDSCNAAVFPDKLAPDFAFPDIARNVRIRVVLPPKGSINCTHGGYIPAQQIKEVESLEHPKNLYLWGWARYRDIFPGSPAHISKFCFRLSNWNGNSLSPKENGTMVFELCPFHNCSDDECETEKPQSHILADIIGRPTGRVGKANQAPRPQIRRQ